MVLRYIGKSEVDHLVHRLPVGGEIVLGAVGADRQAKCWTAVAESRAAADAVSGDGDNQDAGLGNGKVAVIGGHCGRRLFHPGKQFLSGERECALGKGDIELAAADFDLRLRHRVKRSVWHPLPEQVRLLGAG